MSFAAKYLWLIPMLPLLAAGIGALLKQKHRKAASNLAIGALGIAFLLSCFAFITTLQTPAGGGVFRETFNFPWFDMGVTQLELGFVLDPLTAVMLAMVTFVALLIFIYSTGYMAHDENYTRFFCFLSLFAAAMLGIIIANNLLLLFISWELVGLASYLLIGFWYHKPSAAAAAKKAFVTTRIGDIGFFIGIIWLYAETGTLSFYDDGAGCLETSALTRLAAGTVFGGMALSTVISILIFCGAVGKSGQVPLHVWLPDAMEGPTPVSALIHAATMVAAGVFLVARVFPLMSSGLDPSAAPLALQVVTWVGAITAVFAACIAVAQNDIKRILAYSTVSQLGYMMIGLGTGGVSVGVFHLITHAFFKALLFLGSGSVIHGCHEEQDIRKMGGLKKFMPVTFLTYAIGMLALAGFPLLFSGFWSKDEILHAAHSWPKSHIPFYLGVIGAFLTAFYMTRQVCYVFFGKYRATRTSDADHEHTPHESPRVMTIPLMILTVFAIGLGFIGTPAWPWFQKYLLGRDVQGGFSGGVLGLMGLSAVVALTGIAIGWWVYSKATVESSVQIDPLDKLQPALFNALRNKLYIDELYGATVIRFIAALSRFSDWLDRAVWGGVVRFISAVTVALSRINRTIDEDFVNLGFDHGCNGVRDGSRFFSRLQNGQVQSSLRYIGLGLATLLIVLIWGCR